VKAAMVVERYLFAHYTLVWAVVGMVVIKALEGCYAAFLLPGTMTMMIITFVYLLLLMILLFLHHCHKQV
jgi:hypothetical protein